MKKIKVKQITIFKPQPEFPDIDSDVDGNHRDDVIEYLIEKYGRDQVAMVGNVMEYSGKSAIQDLASVYDISPSKTFEVTKKYDNELTLEQNIAASSEIKAYFTKHPEMRDKVDKICGTLRGTSIHAGGVVITDHKYPLNKYCALQRPNENGRIATLWPKSELQQIGLVKYDILGLATAGQLKQINKLVGHDQYEDYPEDPEVFKDIVLLNKHKNIFQFESDLGKRAFNDLKPMSIMELANASGIIRIVGSEAGRHIYELYKDNVAAKQMGDNDFWRKKLRNEIYDDENYEICMRVLAESYGILIYQEQLSYLCVELSRGKLDFNEGNKLRKKLDKLGKKYGSIDHMQGNPVLIQKWHKEFMEIMDYYILPFIGEDGYQTSDKTIRAFLKCKIDDKGCLPVPKQGIIAWMIASSAYLFSKLHAIAYSINTYNMMYLKHYHPLEFWCGSLQYQYDKLEKVKNYINAIWKENKNAIKILPPDVNKSNISFSIEGSNGIRFALGAIMNIGKASQNIIKERRKNGPFKSIEDFCARMPKNFVNKKQLESLLYTGAFSEFGSIKQVFEALVKCGRLDSKTVLITDKVELAHKESSLIGVCLTFKHPIFQERFNCISYHELQDGSRENMAVQIRKISPKMTKTNKPYVLLHCVDLNSNESFNVFDWSNNEMKFTSGQYAIIHVYKNEKFITLRMTKDYDNNKKHKKL